MTSFLNIPFLNPLKWLPNTATPEAGFDDDWAFNQIKSFESKAQYYQKWQIGDYTDIQIESSIPPSDLKIYDCSGEVLSIEFTAVANGDELGVRVYQAHINIDTLPVNKVYYFYFKAEFLNVLYEAISEPVRLQTLWPGTLLFTYRNSFNDFGVAFTPTGVKFSFRCEAGIMDFQPENDTADYIDQIHNLEDLSGTPYRTFKLYIGDERGVAPWVLDLLNRIFVCDYVIIRRNVTEYGQQYSKNNGAKWEVNRVKPWPLYGGSLEIIPTKNKSGLQFTSTSSVAAGLVTAYDIDTNFFGTTIEDQHIIDYEILTSNLVSEGGEDILTEDGENIIIE